MFIQFKFKIEKFKIEKFKIEKFKIIKILNVFILPDETGIINTHYIQMILSAKGGRRAKKCLNEPTEIGLHTIIPAKPNLVNGLMAEGLTYLE